jgi:hypothetical protein
MNRRTATLLATLAVGVALTIGAAAPVAAVHTVSTSATVAVLDDDKAVNGDNAVGLNTCSGGVSKQTIVRSNDIPFNLVENPTLMPLPGASVVFNIPAGDSDQVVLLFTAEGRVQGQPLSYVAPVDFLRVQLFIDGVPVGGNDVSFTSGAGESNATQACKRVSTPVGGAVAHTVTVQWMLIDQAIGSVLTGILDDWSVTVEINN